MDMITCVPLARYSAVSKVIIDRNQITIQQVIRLQSSGYVLNTITDFDSITIVLQSMITNWS